MAAEPAMVRAEIRRESGDKELRMAVVSDATAERNGVGSYYADLISQIEPKISTAELICPEGNETGWKRLLAPPLPGDSTQRIWFPRPVKLWRRLKKLRPHAIVVPTPGPFGLLGMLYARWLQVPLIVGFHTHFEALAGIYWSDFFGRVCHWYLESCNRILFRNSAVVLANSPEMVSLASRLGAKNACLMGTSVASDFLLRELRPADPEARRILFAGRLAAEKNVSLVIEVARQRPALSVSIAGDGPLRSEVEEAAAELPNLHYLGWVPRTELAAAIDANDILLLPSKVESFGTVALEGLARARPVIVSGACGIAEWPELDSAVFTIAEGETVLECVDRVRGMAPDLRASRSHQGHLAARRLNEWNADSWIARIRPVPLRQE